MAVIQLKLKPEWSKITTDPESGLFCKGEKERCFAYTASVACDQNNFILGVKAAPVSMTVRFH